MEAIRWPVTGDPESSRHARGALADVGRNVLGTLLDRADYRQHRVWLRATETSTGLITDDGPGVRAAVRAAFGQRFRTLWEAAQQREMRLLHIAAQCRHLPDRRVAPLAWRSP
jgi:hypothetical protein